MHDASISSAPSSALKLDEYLLWRIFRVVADSEEGIHRLYPYHSSALHTIRRGSHVCQHWRNVILNSPSLWAAVINLTHLQQRKETWRDLVLERSGRALLTVTGAVDVAQSLLCILDTHWTRIRKIDVVVYDFRSLEDERWRALQQPAPNLELFRIGCARGTPLFLQDASSNVLFADHAPLLREFSATQINFLTQPPWLTHLRVLQLSSCFTVPQLLESLMDAHLLEWLDIQNGFTPVAGADRFLELPDIALPLLSRIQIRSRLTTCLDFLEHIRPAVGCSLALHTDDPVDSVTVWGPHLLDTLARVVSRYAKDYFAAHPVRELSLDVNKARFRFSGYTDTLQPFNSPDCHYFNIWLNSRTGFTPDILSVLFGCIAPCALRAAASLTFNIVDILDFDVSEAHFASFIAAVGSIEVLQTGVRTLGLLNALGRPREAGTPDVFSALKTVKIQEVDEAQADLEAVMTEFFMWRRLAIESLELMAYGYATPRPPDLSFLETLVPGMEVIWKSAAGVRRYVCGEGKPNILSGDYQLSQGNTFSV